MSELLTPNDAPPGEQELPVLTAAELCRAERGFHGRFQVKLHIDGRSDPFLSNEALRIIPGTRLVCRGIWRGQAAVVKFFFPQRALRKKLDREVSGIENLATAGLPVPRILGKGSLSGDRDAQVLIFEEIREAVGLREEVDRVTSGEAMLPVLMRLVTFVARQHRAGILQDDLHLDNFLLRGEMLLAIDGGGVRRMRKRFPFRPEAGLENLALLLAQLPLSAERHIPKLFEEYASIRGIAPDARSFKLLQKLVVRQRERRLQTILRKSMRECTDYFTVRQRNQLGVCRRKCDSVTMRHFLENPDAAIARGQMLKNGRSTTVALVDIEGRQFVVKRYNFFTWRRVLRYLLRPTQGLRSWKNAIRLEALGIPHARGIAYVERHIGPLKQAAYFVAERAVGLDARKLFAAEVCADCRVPNSNNDCLAVSVHQSRIADSLITLLDTLAAADLSHGDLKGTNIILQEESPKLIDLDGMRAHRSGAESRDANRRDYIRLLRNFEGSSPLYRQLAAAAGERFDATSPGETERQFPQTLKQDRLTLSYRVGGPIPLMSRRMLGILASSDSPDTGDSEILKSDRRRSIFRIVVGDISVVVKAFPFTRLKDKLRWRRYAAAEAGNAFQAQSRGIATPEYYGLFSIRRGGLVSNCGVIMEDLKDFESIDQLSRVDERKLLLAVPILAELHAAGVNHMDPSPFNLLLHRETGRQVILDWQYASFTTRRNDSQLVLQTGHFLKYAELPPGSPLWRQFVKEVHEAAAPQLSESEFQAFVRTAQGVRLSPRDRARFVERRQRAA